MVTATMIFELSYRLGPYQDIGSIAKCNCAYSTMVTVAYGSNAKKLVSPQSFHQGQASIKGSAEQFDRFGETLALLAR